MDLDFLKTYLSSLPDNIINEIEAYKNKIYILEEDLHEIKKERDIYNRSLCEKDHIIQELQLELNKINDEIVRVKEDNAAFSKVSHIIAMEKENSKLKTEISFLNERLSKALKKKNVEDIISPPQTFIPLARVLQQSIEENKKIILDPPMEKLEELDVVKPDLVNYTEKNIKGKLYYVSNDTSTVYEKLEDGRIGIEMGHLERNKTGKLRIIWLKNPSDTC